MLAPVAAWGRAYKPTAHAAKPCAVDRFIYEKAHELGVKSVILDGPDSWAQSLQEEGKIEKFVPVDFSDAESAFERCVAALNRIKSVSGWLRGCGGGAACTDSMLLARTSARKGQFNVGTGG